VSFFAELKRRNVFRVGAAYGVTAWMLLQITDVIAPILDLPDWVARLLLITLAIGFVPALIFAWVYELTSEGLKKERDVDQSGSIVRGTGRKLDFAIIAILLVAVSLLLVDRFVGNPPPDAPHMADRSIAVLPFVNMSSDQEQEYFSDGISEEILNSLARVKELKVAGRTSSFAFKGQSQDLRRIGDSLGVTHILEGSVRKSGTTVRITAQLIQVEDGFHAWSETYDRELTDVFAIQDEIASEILNQLKNRLLTEEQGVPAYHRTDPETYAIYLLAKQGLYDRTRHTIESAVELLDQAIARDPNYAPAYAQRGIATLLLSDSANNYGTIPAAEALKRGKRYIDSALEIDAQLAEAWAGMGLYHANQLSESDAAIAALTKALSINPNLVDASYWLYIALLNSGDMRGALALSEDITARDPLHGPGFNSAVWTFNQFGLGHKAQALIDRFRAYDRIKMSCLER
jgi:TolB-like protein